MSAATAVARLLDHIEASFDAQEARVLTVVAYEGTPPEVVSAAIRKALGRAKIPGHDLVILVQEMSPES